MCVDTLSLDTKLTSTINKLTGFGEEDDPTVAGFVAEAMLRPWLGFILTSLLSLQILYV